MSISDFIFPSMYVGLMVFEHFHYKAITKELKKYRSDQVRILNWVKYFERWEKDFIEWRGGHDVFHDEMQNALKEMARRIDRKNK